MRILICLGLAAQLLCVAPTALAQKSTVQPEPTTQPEPQQDAQASYYERSIVAPRLKTHERMLVQRIRKWVHKGKQKVQLDTRLSHVAHQAAQWLAETEGQPSLNIPRWIEAAQGLGWTEGQLAAAAIKVTKKKGWPKLLRRQVRGLFGQRRFNRMGVGSFRKGNELCVVTFFSNRQIQLEPIATRVEPGASLLLRGWTKRKWDGFQLVYGMMGEAPRRVQLLPMHAPDRKRSAGKKQGEGEGRGEHSDGGKAQPGAAEHSERGFSALLQMPNKPGRVDVQILREWPKGLEIAAQFPVGVAVSPWIKRQAQIAPDGHRPVTDHSSGNPEHWSESAQRPEDALLALVASTRQNQELAEITRNPELDEVAAAHAADMRSRGFLGHVSPRNGDAATRLRRAGIDYAAVFENIARGPTAASVFDQWMRSPSHRQALLEPAATQVGIALYPVFKQPRAKPKSRAQPAQHAPDHWLGVYMSIEPPAALSREQVKTQALHTLNRIRASQALPLLEYSTLLSRIAQGHSQKLGVGQPASVHDAMNQALGEAEDLLHVGADVFLTPHADAVRSARMLPQPFKQVGVGVGRAQSPSKMWWLTLLYGG